MVVLLRPSSLPVATPVEDGAQPLPESEEVARPVSEAPAEDADTDSESDTSCDEGESADGAAEAADQQRAGDGLDEADESDSDEASQEDTTTAADDADGGPAEGRERQVSLLAAPLALMAAPAVAVLRWADLPSPTSARGKLSDFFRSLVCPEHAQLVAQAKIANGDNDGDGGGGDGGDEAADEDDDEVKACFQRPNLPRPTRLDKLILWRQKNCYYEEGEPKDLRFHFRQLRQLLPRLEIAQTRLDAAIRLGELFVHHIGKYIALDADHPMSRRMARICDKLTAEIADAKDFDTYARALEVIPGLEDDRRVLKYHRRCFERKCRKNRKLVPLLDRELLAGERITARTERRLDSLRSFKNRRDRYTEEVCDVAALLLKHATIVPECLERIEHFEYKLLNGMRRMLKAGRDQDGAVLYQRLWTAYSRFMREIPPPLG